MGSSGNLFSQDAVEGSNMKFTKKKETQRARFYDLTSTTPQEVCSHDYKTIRSLDSQGQTGQTIVNHPGDFLLNWLASQLFHQVWYLPPAWNYCHRWRCPYHLPITVLSHSRPKMATHFVLGFHIIIWIIIDNNYWFSSWTALGVMKMCPCSVFRKHTKNLSPSYRWIKTWLMLSLFARPQVSFDQIKVSTQSLL